jgi:hypothetical protein
VRTTVTPSSGLVELCSISATHGGDTVIGEMQATSPTPGPGPARRLVVTIGPATGV